MQDSPIGGLTHFVPTYPLWILRLFLSGFFIPEDSQLPTEFYDDVNAFRVAVVDKSHVGKLPSEWDVPALYVLLGDRGSDCDWDAYVGKAPAGVKAHGQV